MATVPTPQAVSDHYEEQKRLTVAALTATRRQWRGMGGDWDASWQRVRPRLQVVLTAAQLRSARQGAAYVPVALAQQRMTPRVLGRVVPERFAGTAADGRSLSTLLDGALVKSRQHGTLDAGLDFLESVVETEVEDAARGASSVAISARQRTGWVRAVNAPCCADCAVLAGKFFRSNTGFQRHPRCRCFHVPTTVANPDLTGPPFDPPSSQITGLSDGERKALEQGADLSQVVNSRRGRSKLTTTAGTTRRGRAPGRRRLSPDGIYAIASDETEAFRLLRQHGYIR